MNNGENFNLGNEIRDIIKNAVNNRDFSGLNHDIRNIVNRALDETGISFGRNRINDQPFQMHNKYKQTFDNYNKPPYKNAEKQDVEYNKPVPKPASKTVQYAFPVGKVSGTLQMVFGITGGVFFAIMGIILTFTGYIFRSRMINYTVIMGLLPCFIASIAVAFNGSRIRNRLKRFQRYVQQLHGRNYCLIKDLSRLTGKSDRFTVKDLQKMIIKGMFPQGHVDNKKTCFMLNNESYQQYLLLQENLKMRDMEEKAKKSKHTAGEDPTQKDQSKKNEPLDPMIRKAIEEGRSCVQRIKDANIAIPGEEISRKLDRLEEVIRKIFDYIETHPKKFPEIKKFTGYFLPTTLKLVDAYWEMDGQSVTGKNILSAKADIEQTLDTINLAFENLLDGLFEDIAMDISTDISVMETMFAQEGLTEKNKQNLYNTNGGSKI